MVGENNGDVNMKTFDVSGSVAINLLKKEISAVAR